MTNFNRLEQVNRTDFVSQNKPAKSYDDELLNMIRQKRPEGQGRFNTKGLDNLLVKMKDLYKKTNNDREPTLSELNNGLKFVSKKLHSEVETKNLSVEQKEIRDYVYGYLDKYTFQLATLHFIKEGKPGKGDYKPENLNLIIKKMKEIYKEITDAKPLSLSDLNVNLIYVQDSLKKEVNDHALNIDQKELHDYVKNFLTKYTLQLQGVNFMHSHFIMAMIIKDESTQPEEY